MRCWAVVTNYKKTSSIVLDYGKAATRKLIRNISAAAATDRYLWTASDEGRSVECLERHKNGFRLREQIQLDRVFTRLPGRGRGDEADLEAIAISDGKLWICGSHCRVRRNRKDLAKVDPRFRSRDSRCLLGFAPLAKSGGALSGLGVALPFRGAVSLRKVLGADPYIAPFINLPSKENGLDIEGLCVSGKRLFLGLRGPVVDSVALAIELRVATSSVVRRGKPTTHFLHLGGLGIRDLALVGEDIIVLAGPVNAANSPFRLLRWRPRRGKRVQHPNLLCEWAERGEHPEGICVLNHRGSKGLLVLYDTPAEARVKKARYRADWISLAKLERRAD